MQRAYIDRYPGRIEMLKFIHFHFYNDNWLLS